jgi:hypothetical protein
MRRFELVRHADPSGVSGTGVVANGIQFTDGVVVLRWTCSRPATSVWDNLDDLITVHGHNGRTVVRWLDSRTSAQGT